MLPFSSDSANSNSTSGFATQSLDLLDRVQRAKSEFPVDSLWVFVNSQKTSTYGVKIYRYREVFDDNRGICEFTMLKALNDDSSNEIGETKSIIFGDVEDLRKSFVSSWRQDTDRNFQNKVAPLSGHPIPSAPVPTAVIVETNNGNAVQNLSKVPSGGFIPPYIRHRQIEIEMNRDSGPKHTGTAPIGPGCWYLDDCAPCFCGCIHKISKENDDKEVLCMYPWMCWMIPCYLFPLCVVSENGNMVYRDSGDDDIEWVGESSETFRMYGGLNPPEGSLMKRLC